MEAATPPDPAGSADQPEADELLDMQDLSDHVAETPEGLPVPESHLKLAEERLAEYRRDPSRARPAHDVLDELANR